MKSLKGLLKWAQKTRGRRDRAYLHLATGPLLALERHTNRVADTVLVLANASDQSVTETVALRNGMLMDDAPLREALNAPHLSPTQTQAPTKVGAGFITVTLPPWGVRVLTPVVPDAKQGYSVYKRIP